MISVLEWDIRTFDAINNGLANPVFDAIMPIVRNPYFWAPVYAFFATYLIINLKKKGVYILLFAVFTFALTDEVSNGIKTYSRAKKVARLRPCSDPTLNFEVRSLVPCGPGASFPSSHATNHFGLSVFLIMALRKRMKWIAIFTLPWAILVSFAQIYVGLHFPMDTIFGGLIGTLIGGWMGYFCMVAVRPYEEEIVKI